MNASNNDYWVQGLLRFLAGEPHRSGKALLFFCVRAKARARVSYVSLSSANIRFQASRPLTAFDCLNARETFVSNKQICRQNTKGKIQKANLQANDTRQLARKS